MWRQKMTPSLLLLAGLIVFAQVIHGAPSTKELDILLVPKQSKYPPVVIFEFKEKDSTEQPDDDSDEDASNETSTTTKEFLNAHRPIFLHSDRFKESSEQQSTTVKPSTAPKNVDEDESDFSLDSNKDSSYTTKPEVRLDRLRREASVEDNHSHEEENNKTNSSSGLNSDEVIVATSEDDNKGHIFTRISVFKFIHIPFNKTNSTEDEDQTTESSQETSTPEVLERRKRQAGYGALEAEPGNNGRALPNAPEELKANTTAPTFVENPSAGTSGPTTSVPANVVPSTPSAVASSSASATSAPNPPAPANLVAPSSSPAPAATSPAPAPSASNAPATPTPSQPVPATTPLPSGGLVPVPPEMASHSPLICQEAAPASSAPPAAPLSSSTSTANATTSNSAIAPQPIVATATQPAAPAPAAAETGGSRSNIGYN